VVGCGSCRGTGSKDVPPPFPARHPAVDPDRRKISDRLRAEREEGAKRAEGSLSPSKGDGSRRVGGPSLASVVGGKTQGQAEGMPPGGRAGREPVPRVVSDEGQAPGTPGGQGLIGLAVGGDPEGKTQGQAHQTLLPHSRRAPIGGSGQAKNQGQAQGGEGGGGVKFRDRLQGRPAGKEGVAPTV
jgi:hypothetical protein